VISDHCAVVVKNRIVDWGPKPFKVFDAWSELEGYKDVIKQAWEREVNSGNSLEKVKTKLKGLKQALRQWREQVINNEREKKRKFYKKLNS